MTENMAYRDRPHQWGPPPPGSGREETCRKCGYRKSQAPDQCSGMIAEHIVDTQSDYDPIP